MPGNSIRPDDPQRVSVVCDCGKKIVANSVPSQKRLKCPSCGEFVAVPRVRGGSVRNPKRAASELHLKAGNRRLVIVLWTLPVVIAIGAGVFLHFDGKGRQQARIDAAIAEVREAVKEADGWLKQGSVKEGEHVEDRLMKAIAANDVSEKANADAVLEMVRTRRAELAAESIFDSAKTKLDEKAIDQSVALLQRYIADERAMKKPEAEQLLDDCVLATSQTAALQTLMAMSEEEFVQFTNTGKLDDGEITHPVLMEIRATRLRQNLEAANQRREENRIAEANRQKKENEIAEANRQEMERLANNAGELIKARLVGDWRWGDDLDLSIKFAPDGTFVDIGRRGETGGGLWKVDKDGTIRLSDDHNSWPAVVRMNLNEDKISIEITTADGLTELGASRFKELGMTPAETNSYVEKQIEDLAPSRPGFARSRSILRRDAADNLRALGPAAIAAVPALAAVALNDNDAWVKRKTIKALGEIGGPQGITAIGMTLLQTPDPEVGAAAEDALLKLLPAIRRGPRTDRKIILGMAPLDPEQRAAYMKRLPKLPFSSPTLTMDEAIFLFQLHGSGNQRVSPAIESAWAAGGFTRNAVANEIKRRDKQRMDEALAKARDAETARQQRKEEYEKEVAEKLNRLKEPSPFSSPPPGGVSNGEDRRLEEKRRRDWEEMRGRMRGNRS